MYFMEEILGEIDFHYITPISFISVIALVQI